MPDQVELPQSDKDFVDQMIGFAERRAANGVYMLQGFSVSRQVPVTIVVALGDQAEALNKVIGVNTAPDEVSLITRVSKANGNF